MRTNNPDFSSVAEMLSVPVITEVELFSISKYKFDLVDELIYTSMPNHKSDAILIEIKRVDAWLKKHNSDFILDNNRKFIQ